ncbi:type II toxin-antitoxin system RelE/ParE family toxin [Brevundimonas faecalis]|uniref:type II toxin-antitoxin system RelE/ParE family toxin n=1 Tax=Brevundimonas faecalis TaxID=947378 RepID=UPI003616DD61
MSSRIVFAPTARADQERLLAFLQAMNPNAARRAYGVMIAAFDHLSLFPQSGSPSGMGRVYVRRFGQGGYVIRYRVYDEIVLVTRIFHTREDR